MNVDIVIYQYPHPCGPAIWLNGKLVFGSVQTQVDPTLLIKTGIDKKLLLEAINENNG